MDSSSQNQESKSPATRIKHSSDPNQQSSSTKTSPHKHCESLHPLRDNIRRISQAKSIDIECVVTDDDEDDNNHGILVAQRSNNYLSFDSDMLKSRPHSLRFKENSDYLANHYESNKFINPEHVNLETKYLSNPILSNEKKKLNFRNSKKEQNASEKKFGKSLDVNSSHKIDAIKNDNKLPIEKNSLSSNNSVFFRSKTDINTDSLNRDNKSSPIKVTIEPCSPIESIDLDLKTTKKPKPLLKAFSVNRSTSDASQTGLSGTLTAAYNSYLNRTRSVSLKQDTKNVIDSNIEMIKKHSSFNPIQPTSSTTLLNHAKPNPNICNKRLSNNGDYECECESCTMQNQLNNEDLNEPKATYSYLKSYVVSMLQPSDNKLAMKLFGSKKGVLKEKLRQQEVGHWIIHPCSNFR